MSHSVKIYNTCIGCVRNVRIQINGKCLRSDLVLAYFCPQIFDLYILNEKFLQLIKKEIKISCFQKKIVF
jgi:hypothetical protein